MGMGTGIGIGIGIGIRHRRQLATETESGRQGSWFRTEVRTCKWLLYGAARPLCFLVRHSKYAEARSIVSGRGSAAALALDRGGVVLCSNSQERRPASLIVGVLCSSARGGTCALSFSLTAATSSIMSDSRASNHSM